MTVIAIYPYVAATLVLLTFFVSGFLGFKNINKLNDYLKTNKKDRYAEISGSVFNGKEWVGGGRTSQAVSYLFSTQDNEDSHILNHKRSIKKAFMLFFLCVFEVFLFAIIYVVATS